VSGEWALAPNLQHGGVSLRSTIGICQVMSAINFPVLQDLSVVSWECCLILPEADDYGNFGFIVHPITNGLTALYSF
jgi:hypothetical protein